MITRHLRRLSAIALLLALLVGTLGLVSCGQSATPLLELDDNTISVNQYRFLLSRVKGSLGYAGYTIDSDDFWDMVIDSDGTTYDEYFRQAALVDARRYLAALALFDEEKLVLPKSVTEAIDAEIDEYIQDAGSKSSFNTLLSQYGINVDMLRELYIIEAKYDYVKDHFYGSDGSKVAAQVRHEYLTEYAVCFRQVLIRAFDYEYDTDANGDDIYYKVGSNNAKVNNIAYDTVKGTVRLDEFGETITDKNGDTIYYLENGKIAYDTENGVRAIVYDSDGNPKTIRYSAEELAAHKEAAEEIIASVEPGDYAAFEALLAEYAATDDDAFDTDEAYCFLYTTGDNSYDYLNDIADILADAEEGTIHMVSSEYGYNVVMKYPIPDDAVTNEAYEDWFGDLTDRVVAKLFHTKCEPYMEQVTVNDEAFATLPSMKDLAANYNY